MHGAADRLDDATAAALLGQLKGWRIVNGRLRKEVPVADFVAAMQLANAVANIAERENHHPELAIAYARVRIDFCTHDVGGLSRNDFICAARIDRLPFLSGASS
ncbi:4a-hydroxytetrahydrobiopterin dehydratase [Rhodocyclus tenuis]|uniref:4a-hydroxytetrahydrobiopterin dehydratase n=1 Tax=Rhodocyclus gracilis TaxID=2929842 RepID=UPI001298DE71|nr:4a-hydroxytetrahydrobiopterin dehydratase [Rhodocyclus gracilis]MRD72489.1 4a-hydroxytetrahydrobiopterin dehydratase [Rhodocyclus gracilis]